MDYMHGLTRDSEIEVQPNLDLTPEGHGNSADINSMSNVWEYMSQENPVDWDDILANLDNISPRDICTNFDTALDILGCQNPVKLCPDSDNPGIMSPLDSIKYHIITKIDEKHYENENLVKVLRTILNNTESTPLKLLISNILSSSSNGSKITAN